MVETWQTYSLYQPPIQKTYSLEDEVVYRRKGKYRKKPFKIAKKTEGKILAQQFVVRRYRQSSNTILGESAKQIQETKLIGNYSSMSEQ